MEEKEHLTKRDLKAMRNLDRLETKTLEQKQNLIKIIVIGIASVLFLVFFAAVIIISKQKVSEIKLSTVGWVRGDQNAKVTLIEFSDLQCPACKAYQPVIEQTLKDFNGRVKLLYKHFPLSIHKNSTVAAIAAEAAGAQGKFFEMHDKLFEKQADWSALDASTVEEVFVSYAKELNLDIEKFKKDLNDKTLAEKISSQQNEGTVVGVNSTPSFYIGVGSTYRKIENASQVYSEFKKVIESEVNKK